MMRRQSWRPNGKLFRLDCFAPPNRRGAKLELGKCGQLELQLELGPKMNTETETKSKMKMKTLDFGGWKMWAKMWLKMGAKREKMCSSFGAKHKHKHKLKHQNTKIHTLSGTV